MSEIPSDLASDSTQTVSNSGPSVCKRAWKATRVYYVGLLNGLLFATLLNEVVKTLVAEPRPHFLDTCQPINLNCSQNEAKFVPYNEIKCGQNNTANNGVPRAISDAMKSFPSGHAQLSTFMAVFMVVNKKKKNRLILLFVTLSVLCRYTFRRKLVVPRPCYGNICCRWLSFVLLWYHPYQGLLTSAIIGGMFWPE